MNFTGLMVAGAIAAVCFLSDADNRTAAAEAPTFKVPAGISSHNQQIAIRAWEILADQCPGFRKYWSDIEGGNFAVYADAGSEYDYRTEQWGWTDWVVVSVRVKDDPQTIPADYRASGHTLHYYLGAGEQPGIVGQKVQSQKVCGSLPVDDSRDTFKAVPDLKFVSDLN